MTTDEALRVAAADREDSTLVVGVGETGRAAAASVARSGDVPATTDAAAPDVFVLAADGAAGPKALPDRIDTDAAVRAAVVTVPRRPDAGERELLEALGGLVDTVVLASGEGAEDLAAAVRAFVSIGHDAGLVNVDLADVETVFESASTAALGVGSGPTADPAAAVESAFSALPAGIETDPAGGALLDLIGPPEMTVEDVNGAVSTVRGRVGPEAHLIWGGAVDPALERTVRVRLVLAGVESVRVAPGDRCPRCGGPISTYEFGDRTTPACEDCGFVGVSVRLRE